MQINPINPHAFNAQQLPQFQTAFNQRHHRNPSEFKQIFTELQSLCELNPEHTIGDQITALYDELTDAPDTYQIPWETFTAFLIITAY